jgi:hypothetical protein
MRWNDQEYARVGHSLGTNSGPLLDHLIRPQQKRRRDRQAERLGGLEGDDPGAYSGVGQPLTPATRGRCSHQHRAVGCTHFLE